MANPLAPPDPAPVDLPDWTVPENLKWVPQINQGNILAGVKTEVDAEIQGQTDPLQGLIDKYMTQSGRAVTDLNTLYDEHLLPSINAAASRLTETYDKSIEGERQVQAAAAARLQQLHQQRASDAQALAQQIGGPVPLEMFVNPVDIEQTLLVGQNSNDLLYSGMLRDAGIAESEAFTQRVFPLLRAEQTQQARNYFRDKVKEIEGEIAKIKGMRKGMIDERLRQRFIEERQYELNKLTANREFWLNRKSSELESARIQAGLYGTDVSAESAAADRAAGKAAVTKQEKTAKAKIEADKAARAQEFDALVKGNISSLVTGAFTGGKPQNIKRLVKDIAGNTKSVEQTVSSPGGINPQTGEPWASKQEVINWVLANVNVNNAKYREYIRTKIDLLWPAFAKEQIAAKEAAGVAKNKQQAFSHDLALAKELGFKGFPADLAPGTKAQFLKKWLAEQQAKRTHSADDPKTIEANLSGETVEHLEQRAKSAGWNGKYPKRLEIVVARDPNSDNSKDMQRKYLVDWLMKLVG